MNSSSLLLLLLGLLLDTIEAACPSGYVKVTSSSAFVAAIANQSATGICVSGFFDLDRDINLPPLPLNRNLTVVGELPTSGWNNRVRTLFAPQNTTLAITSITILEAFQAAVNWGLVDSSSFGDTVLTNVTTTLYCYDVPTRTVNVMWSLAARADPSHTVELSPNTIALLEFDPFRFQHISSMGYLDDRARLAFYNLTISCIAGPPPYITTVVEPIGSLLPSQIVCQNRSDKGTSYRGIVSTTAAGDRCNKWIELVSPTKLHYYLPFNFPNRGMVSNYCRNPSAYMTGVDVEDTVWCYSSQPADRLEACNVPFCEDLTEEQILKDYKRILSEMDAMGGGGGLSDRDKAAIGASIGGAAFLAIIILTLAFLLRRGRRRQEEEALSDALYNKESGPAAVVVMDSRRRGSNSPVPPASGGSDQEEGDSQGGVIEGRVRDQMVKAFQLQTGKIALSQLLDEGGTGLVYLGEMDSERVAVKVMPNVDEREGLAESLLGIIMTHPNVIRIYGFFLCSALPADLIEEGEVVRRVLTFPRAEFEYLEPVLAARGRSSGVEFSHLEKSSVVVAGAVLGSQAVRSDESGQGAGPKAAVRTHVRTRAVGIDTTQLSETLLSAALGGALLPETFPGGPTSTLRSSAVPPITKVAPAPKAEDRVAADEAPAALLPLERRLTPKGPAVRCVGVVMEFAQYGSLYALLARGGLETVLPGPQGPPIASLMGVADVARTVAVARQVAAGLTHLHNLNIIHGDMKSLNVLLEPSGLFPGLMAKVSDFGTSTYVHNRRQGNIRVTWIYLAPELLHTSETSMEADVFAFGRVLWELFHQDWMTWGPTASSEFGVDFKYPTPAAIAELVARCVAADPAARPTMTRVVAELAAFETLLGSPELKGPSDFATNHDLLSMAHNIPFVSGPVTGPHLPVNLDRMEAYLEKKKHATLVALQQGAGI